MNHDGRLDEEGEHRFLFLEDSPADAELMEKALRKADLRFISKRAGTKAAFLSALSEFTPDLVLADYKVPGYDGLSAVEAVRKLHPHVPVIMVSGILGDDLAVETVKRGATDYVLKDNLARLAPAVRRAIEEARDRLRRIQAEERLRESEERYQSLFSRSLDGIYLHDLDGNFLDANPAVLKMLGYERSEITRLNIKDLLPDDQVQDVFQAAKLIVETGTHPRVMEYRLKRKDASWVWVETQGSLVFKDGRSYAIQGIIRDITARMLAMEEIAGRERELRKTLDQVRATLNNTVKTIERLAEVRDPYTAGHQRRVAQLSCAIAQEMGCEEDLISGLQIMASIHDIGKTAVPSDILSKPSALNENEFAIIKTHPLVAYDILREMDFTWPVAAAIYQHHERLDGSGYPRGLKGDQIIFEARVLAVADVVEAMASHRPYRPALGLDRALQEITEKRGVLYDASVVESCLHLIREKNYRLDSTA